MLSKSIITNLLEKMNAFLVEVENQGGTDYNPVRKELKKKKRMMRLTTEDELKAVLMKTQYVIVHGDRNIDPKTKRYLFSEIQRGVWI